MGDRIQPVPGDRKIKPGSHSPPPRAKGRFLKPPPPQEACSPEARPCWWASRDVTLSCPFHWTRGAPTRAPYGLTCLAESAVWEPAEEIQKQQWMAEAVGSLHKLLPVLLQVAPGMCPGWRLGKSLKDPPSSGSRQLSSGRMNNLTPKPPRCRRGGPTAGWARPRPSETPQLQAKADILHLPKGCASAGWMRGGGRG